MLTTLPDRDYKAITKGHLGKAYTAIITIRNYINKVF